MTAHAEHFPWPSYYGEFKFFEGRMRTHQRVRELIRTDQDGLYILRLVDGGELRVFVCSVTASASLNTTKSSKISARWMLW